MHFTLCDRCKRPQPESEAGLVYVLVGNDVHARACADCVGKYRELIKCETDKIPLPDELRRYVEK